MRTLLLIFCFLVTFAEARESGSHKSNSEGRSGAQGWDEIGRQVDLSATSTSAIPIGKFKSQCGTLGDRTVKFRNYSLVQRWAQPVADPTKLPEPAEEGAKNAECMLLVLGDDRRVTAEVLPMGDDGEGGSRLTVIAGEVIGKRKGMNYMLLPGGYLAPAPCHAQGEESHFVVKQMKVAGKPTDREIMSSTVVQDKSNRDSEVRKPLPNREEIDLSDM